MAIPKVVLAKCKDFTSRLGDEIARVQADDKDEDFYRKAAKKLAKLGECPQAKVSDDKSKVADIRPYFYAAIGFNKSRDWERAEATWTKWRGQYIASGRGRLKATHVEVMTDCIKGLGKDIARLEQARGNLQKRLQDEKVRERIYLAVIKTQADELKAHEKEWERVDAELRNGSTPRSEIADRIKELRESAKKWREAAAYWEKMYRAEKKLRKKVEEDLLKKLQEAKKAAANVNS